MTVEGPKPASTGGPSMFRTAVEAAADALPDAPMATVEQVALAVLRVALPLHETQHADAWKAAYQRAVHFELEAVKAAERAESVEKELERYRGVDAAAKELLARNVEMGTRADNAEAKCEDLEDELERLRAYTAPTVKVEWGVQDATEPVDPWGAVIHDSREDARRAGERYSREVLTNGKPTPYRIVTRLAGAWIEAPDA